MKYRIVHDFDGTAKGGYFLESSRRGIFWKREIMSDRDCCRNRQFGTIEQAEEYVRAEIACEQRKKKGPVIIKEWEQ